jgi:hypothetical protein
LGTEPEQRTTRSKRNQKLGAIRRPATAVLTPNENTNEKSPQPVPLGEIGSKKSPEFCTRDNSSKPNQTTQY